MSETENKPARQSLTPQASAGGREYEMPYFISAEVPEDKLDFEVEELNGIISKNGGVVIQTNPLESKRLAYPVKKQYKAYFGVVYFAIDAEGLDKIKKALTFHKKIIRFLILNNPIKPKPAEIPTVKREEPQPQAQTFDQKLEGILNR